VSEAPLMAMLLDGMLPSQSSNPFPSYSLRFARNARSLSQKGYVRGPHFFWHRCVTLISMFFLTATHCFMVTLASCFIISIKGSYFVAFLAANMAFVYAFKIATSDFFYHFNLPPKIDILVSIISRLVQKQIATFTGMIHLRHPYELGGVLMVWNYVEAAVGVFVAAWFYLKYSEETDSKLSESFIYTLLPILLSVWALSLLAFFISIDRGPTRPTFFVMMTAPEYAMHVHDKFALFDIFSKHHSYYQKHSDRLRKWVHSNWRVWMIDGVMTEGILLTIPESYIPEEDLEQGVAVNFKSLAALHKKRSDEELLLLDYNSELGEDEKGEVVVKEEVGAKTGGGGDGGNKSLTSVHPM
jgi:hypothetical protein